MQRRQKQQRQQVKKKRKTKRKKIKRNHRRVRKTAKRQTKADETVDTTTGYTVHPAFTNESSIGYANGGWNQELAGIWVAKFEAGYASGNNKNNNSQ